MISPLRHAEYFSASLTGSPAARLITTHGNPQEEPQSEPQDCAGCRRPLLTGANAETDRETSADVSRSVHALRVLKDSSAPIPSTAEDKIFAIRQGTLERLSAEVCQAWIAPSSHAWNGAFAAANLARRAANSSRQPTGLFIADPTARWLRRGAHSAVSSRPRRRLLSAMAASVYCLRELSLRGKHGSWRLPQCSR